MAPIRVLVVDDSAVIRRLLCAVLAADADLEVAGTAPNGSLALAKIPQLSPDLVTLDIEMPGMDGLETVVEIRKIYPKLPVIMFSTLTERGAATTLDALARGASDYVTKPSQTASVEDAKECVRAQLVPKIKSLCAPRAQKTRPALAPKVPVAPARRSARVDLVAIGSSTGGPNALHEVLTMFPSSFPVPVVIVQHMPPLFTRMLAERLNAASNLEVQEGVAGVVLQPGQIWIAPGDHHMVLARKASGEIALAIQDGPPENSCRPAVDVLFRSAAETVGANTLAVILTGMGSDGTIGARAIREAGGEVFVQDEASAVVWGMPGSIVAAGQADRIFPLASLGSEITRRVIGSRWRTAHALSPR